MKLDAVNIIPGDDGAESLPVVSLGDDHAAAGRPAKVGMDEISISAGLHTSQEPVAAIMLNLIPAHMRDLGALGRKTFYAALDQAQPESTEPAVKYNPGLDRR